MTENEENIPVDKEVNPAVEAHKKEVIGSFLRLLINAKNYFKTVLDIKDGTDIPGTIEGIRKDIDFNGVNAYILIFSIFIASMGLNLNSVAVIIGAMLISPLMGPILGLGLSVGTINMQMLTRSLRSFATAIVISLVVSTIYFLLSPFKESTPELLARTSPTLFDAFIALFGGFAGIIAGSRKQKTNVVPGVAIATALMPPLCTAGYGLAMGDWSIFLGAFYLFFLNSFFITIATLIVVRYLRFPIHEFLDKQKEKRVKIYIVSICVLILIPSVFIFKDVLDESLFTRRALIYYDEVVSYEGAKVVSKQFVFGEDEKLSVIEIAFMGEEIPDRTIHLWESKLATYELEEVTLDVIQSKDRSDEVLGRFETNMRVEVIQELYKENKDLLASKDDLIIALEDELVKYKKNEYPISQLMKEAKIIYPDLTKLYVANMPACTSINVDSLHTRPVVITTWIEDSDTDIEIFKTWISTRIGVKNILLVEE